MQSKALLLVLPDKNLVKSMINNINKTILVVEDDVSTQKVLSEKFTSQGFAITAAKNGEEGLKIALEKHPDLIILDILMPVKDGVAFIEDIRRDSWGKDAKIIVFTNYSSTDILLKITQGFPSYYLVKSDTSLEDLLIKVEALIST